MWSCCIRGHVKRAKEKVIIIIIIIIIIIKDLEIEIERMWGMKATTIPVVIGVLGLIKKVLEKYTKQISGNIKIRELQKIALLGTSCILRKKLSIK